MKIDIKDSVILDDENEYLVASKINYENKEYYYLVNIDENEVKFCYLDNDELVEINDKDLATKLLPLFAEVSTQVLNENFSDNNA